MVAGLIDGKAHAAALRLEVKERVSAMRSQGVSPKLAVILVGDDPASVYYAESKAKLARSLGIDLQLFRFEASVPASELTASLQAVSNDETVHGVLVELPLPKHIPLEATLVAIDPRKDVDGVTMSNRGRLLSGTARLLPATPLSCLELLRRSQVELRGRRVCLIGRGETVGKPLTMLLIQSDATVTVCHSKTRDVADATRSAEVIIVAAGRPNLLTAEMVSEGAVVIDAGVNEVSPGRYVGDADFEGVRLKASLITPVPGGVGAMTTTILMRNLLDAIEWQREG